MKKTLIQIFNNKFLRGGTLLTATNFLVGFLNYLFNSLAGKALGPAKYSEITALFSYLLIFSVPITTIATEIIRRLGQLGEKRLTAIRGWELWILQKITQWSFLMLPYFLLLIWIPRLTNLTTESSVSLLLILLLSVLSVFYTASLLGLHLIWAYSLVLVASTVIKLTGPILVMFQIGDISLILLLIIISSFALLIFGKILLQQTINKISISQPTVDKRITQLIFSKSIFVIFTTAISINLLYNLDVIFVKKFFLAQTAGLYGAWNLYAKIIFYILSPILTISFIFFSAKEQQKRHTKTLVLTIMFLIIVGFGFYLFYRLFPEFTILFIFSRQYLAIKPLLPYAAIFGTGYCLISFVSSYFVAKNSYKAIVIFPFILTYAALLAVFARGLQQVITINLVVSSLIFITYLGLILIESKKSES